MLLNMLFASKVKIEQTSVYNVLLFSSSADRKKLSVKSTAKFLFKINKKVKNK